MRRFLDKYIYLSQPIMLLVTLYSNFFYLNFVVAGNLIGYSVLTNLVFLYLFNFKGNCCWFTRNAPKFLILVNISDIIGCYISYDLYTKIFNIAICFISLVLFSIYQIKRLRND